MLLDLTYSSPSENSLFPGHVCQKRSVALCNITAAEVVITIKANSKLIKRLENIGEECGKNREKLEPKHIAGGSIKL